ncbi:MAG: GNAT family N-acetyltransferase [Caldilineaceae bacterium]
MKTQRETTQTEPLLSRRLSTEQCQAASRLLAHAFMPNEFCRYLEPDEAQRFAKIKFLFAGMTAVANRYGSVLTHGSPLQGTTVWFPPGTYPLTSWQMLRAGLLQCPFTMGIRTTQRLLQLAAFTEAVHAQLMHGRPYWYLLFAGVDPRQQDQGIGTALVAKMHAYLDAEGQPALLEANSEELVGYWERFGYAVELETAAPGGGVPYWFMVRRPDGAREMTTPPTA